MRFARLDGGSTVIEVVDLESAEDLAERFPPALGFLEVPDEVGPNWRHVDGAWEPPSPPMPTQAAVRAEAERRIEIGFLLPDGTRFRCDTGSVARLSGFRDALQLADAAGASPPSVTFVTAAGTPMTLSSLAQAQALVSAATAHVAGCLTASATIQALDPIPADFADDARWP